MAILLKRAWFPEDGSGSDVEMRSEGSESGPDSPGTDAATAGSRSGAGSPPHTAMDIPGQGSPTGSLCI